MSTPDKRFNGLSISTGAVRYSYLGYLLLTQDDLVVEGVPHSMLFTLNRGNWGAQNLQWMACSGSVIHVPNERFLALGEEGFVWAIGGGESKEEDPVGDGELSPETRGPLREIRGICRGKAYAVGTCRQAYVRDESNVWRCIDQTAQTAVADITNTSFESIDGFSEQEIYTVGWEGEIWQYDGTRFVQIESPTNLALYKVRCGADGYVYACGQLGILLRGRGNKWEVIDHESTVEDLWGMEYFNEKLYVSSTHFVYALENGKLERVDFGEDIPGTCYHLSAADGIMWSIGAKDVMEFNGEAWKRILEID
ncbi:hypothetical protein D9M69_462900 [compost metagenome]